MPLNYERPTSLWESFPWWIRWPLAVLALLVFVFFMTAPLHPWIR